MNGDVDRMNRWLTGAFRALPPIAAATIAVGLSGASSTASPAARLPDAIALTGSPNGKKPSQIYLLNLANGNLRRLTRGPGDHRAWAWSPNGSRLLVSQRGGLYAVRTDGSKAIRLATRGDGSNASWSPNGTRLAYREAGALYVVDSNGRHRRRLARAVVGGGGYSGNVSWSPDGRLIAFARRDGIFTVSSTGGARPRRIAIRPRPRTHCCAGPSRYLQPTWSPRGSRIAAVIDDAAAGRYAIYVMNRDGTQAKRLGPGHGPLWSPDALKIAYRDKADGLMTADGTRVRRWQACWCGISFSPDGSRLAYPGGKARSSSGALFLAYSGAEGRSRVLYAPGGAFRLPLWRRGTATTEGG